MAIENSRIILYISRTSLVEYLNSKTLAKLKGTVLSLKANFHKLRLRYAVIRKMLKTSKLLVNCPNVGAALKILQSKF